VSVSASTSIIEGAEVVDSFDALGVLAFTTSRAVGSFGTATDEPARDVMARWSALRALVGGDSARLGTAMQVHGNRVIEHAGEWRGWLRGESADGHLSTARGTAMAVTVADCVPVFLAHPSGATAALHSGWRGTAARIAEQALAQFRAHGLASSDFHLHCGPAICGKCYEVSASVYAELTGTDPGKPTTIDLRALIVDHARAAGVRHVSSSSLCTRCDNDRFYSHRAGDAGRQLGVIVAAT
jgi:YfiH family protein